MSTTLFFLVPIAMLAVVWSLCFVGCVLPVSGLPADPYSNTVLAETSLVAYWPLNDAAGLPLPNTFPAPAQGSSSLGAATDFSGKGHIGSYIIPPNYPAKPPAGSAEIPGSATLNLQQGSIVPGDVSNQSGTDKLTNPASVDFEGGYVSIPWSMQSPPKLDQFTLEAWIMPTPAATGFDSVVFSALVNNTGFRVLINDQNQLEAIIGNGTASPATPALSVPIDPTTTTYIAVTCDLSGTVTLFASGVDDATATPQTFPGTGYVPVDPTQQVTYFIGAGDNELPLRTPTMNPDGAPEFPFQGRIQSVALYNSSSIDFQTHFSGGSGG